MIRVTVELLPGGSERNIELLGIGYIHNDLSNPERPRLGNYGVRLTKRGSKTVTWKWGRVENFPRKRLGPWDLLRRALNITLEGREQ